MLMFQPLIRYADFRGRARRAEYWLFTLLLIILTALTLGVTGLSGRDLSGASAVGTAVLGLLMLATVLPSIAVTVRRLHDIDRSGWWLLAAFVPLAGPVALLVFTLLDGTHGSNQFGPDPKNRPDLTAATFS